MFQLEMTGTSGQTTWLGKTQPTIKSRISRDRRLPITGQQIMPYGAAHIKI